MGICGSNTTLHGTKSLGGLTVSSIKEILGTHPSITFMISTPPYIDEIYSKLGEMIDFDKVRDVDLECTHYFDAFEFKNFFPTIIKRFASVQNRLDDEISKSTYEKVVKAHLSGERVCFREAYTGGDDWYLFASLLSPPPAAIYIDCGAFGGDTIDLFIAAVAPSNPIRSSAFRIYS